QTLHGFPGDFAANGVEAGKDDGAGGVVDEDGDAGGGFEGADVAAFAANDAAFHFLPLNIDSGSGGFKRVMSGVTLNGEGDDAAGLLLGAGFGVLDDVLG